MNRPVFPNIRTCRLATCGRWLAALAMLIPALVSVPVLAQTPLIRTYAGTGSTGFSGDNGQALAANIQTPIGIAVDGAGNLWVNDSFNQRIRKISLTGVITTVAGNGTLAFAGDGGPASAASLANPAGIALDPAGNLYIAERDSHRVRRINTAGIITTVAGSGVAGFSGDGGQATAAQMRAPLFVIWSGGNLYVSERDGHRIRKVDLGTGIISTVVGTGTAGFSGDGGQATLAQVNVPAGMLVNASNELIFADRANHRIRKVAANGVITTISGTGVQGFGGDNGAATAALLSEPTGVRADTAGNLYIPERGGHRIRRIDTSGVITTFAGTGVSGFSGDNGPAASAQLFVPQDIAFDSSGGFYVADTSNNRIRYISTSVQPGAPTSLVATPGDRTVTVSFSTPTSNGGSPLVDYLLDCEGNTAAGAASPLTVTGLANGVLSSCKVTARTALGSRDSVLSNFFYTQAPQVIMVGTLPQVSVGQSASITLTGGGSAKPVLVTSTTSSVCSVSSVSQTPPQFEFNINGIAVGQCELVASQQGTLDFLAATNVNISMPVAVGTQAGFAIVSPSQSLVLGETLALSTTGGSGTGAVSYVSDNANCRIVGSSLVGDAVGSCTVTATKAADANFTATQATATFTVTAQAQTVQFGTLPSIVDQASATLTATGGGSGNAITFASLTPAVCIVSASTVTGVTPGICTVRATQAGNASYLEGTAQASFNVMGSQVISFGAVAPLALGRTANIPVTGGASGMPVVLTSATPATCSATGLTVTALQAGECRLNANQAAGGFYLVAAQVVLSVQVSTGNWIALASMPGTFSEFIGARLNDSRFLAAGKTVGGGSASLIYNPATNLWSSTTGRVTSGQGGTATTLADGRVLVTEGQTTFGHSNRSEMFDPASNSWSLTGTLQTARGEHAAIRLQDGRILVTGGKSGTQTLRSAEIFDPATGTWTTIAQMNMARRNHTLVLLNNGSVFVYGGRGGFSGGDDFVMVQGELYNPSNDTWISLNNMPVARVHHSLLALPQSNRTLVAGGEDANGPSNRAFLSAANGTWVETPPMNHARSRHTTTLLPNGKILVAGGYGPGNIPAPPEVYDPANNLWQLAGELSASFENHRAALLDGLGAVVAGGNVPGTSTQLNTLYMYDTSIGVPSAPTLTSAVAGSGAAIVTFTPGVSTADAMVLGHIAVATPGGASATCRMPCSSLTLNGLQNGTAYTITVAAYNGMGYGGSSAPSDAVTPVDGRTPQTITFAQPTDKVRIVDASFNASIGSSSGLAVVLTSQTTATCTVQGGNQVVIQAVGTCTLAANQAGNTTYLPAPAVVRSFNISKAPRSVAFGPAPTNLAWGNYAPISIIRTGFSGGPVAVLTSQTPTVCSASINNQEVQGLTPGTCSLLLEWPGDNDFETATPAVTQFVVGKRSNWTASISVSPFTPFMGQTGSLSLFGEDGSRTGALTWSSETANCTVSGATFQVVTVGPCQFRATRAEDALYLEASKLSSTITPQKADQASLSVLLTPSTLAFGQSGVLFTSGGSGTGAVSFVSSSPTVCSISGNQLTALAAGGFCQFAAIKAADGNFNEKQSAQSGFQVQRASQTVAWQTLPTRRLGDAAFSLTAFATASSGGSVQFISQTTAVCITGGTDGAQLTLLAAGTCTVSATASASSNYNSSPSVTQSFEVDKANQSISFGAQPVVPLGTSRTVTVTGGASGQPVVLTPVTPATCSVSGNTVTGLAVGNCTVAANQAGNSNYNAAPEQRATITISQGVQTISFAPLPIFGPGETVNISATGGASGNPVTFTAQTPTVCTVSGNQVTGVAAGQCFVRANQAGNSSYLVADPVDQSSTLAAGTWTAAGNMQTARREHAVTRLADGSVLAIGGSDGTNVLVSVERFDPVTRTWSPVASLNTARRWHSATLLADGRVLVVGGMDASETPLASVERYDPASNTWSVLSPLPDVRVKHVAIKLPDGKVLLAGGMAEFGNEPNMTYLFDPVTGGWAQNNYISYARSNFAHAFLASGRILFAGGDAYGSTLAEADLYEPTNNAWQSAEYMNSGRPNFNYETRRDLALHTLPDGRAVAIGGYDVNRGAAVAIVLAYSEQTTQWSTLTPLDAGRESFLSAKLVDGRIFVAGGVMQDGTAGASSRILSTAGNSWEGSGRMVNARSGTPLIALGNGRYLAAGGVGADGAALASSETFDLSTAVPDAPIMGSAVAGNGSATITFTAPAGQGVVINTAISTPQGLTGTCTSPCGSIVVNGLTNGTSYTFVVRSLNANGTGPASAASNAVVPSAPLLAQTITWGADPVVRVGVAATLSATGGLSGNPVVFTSQTPSVCSTTGSNGATVTGLTTGTCTVAANQAGNAQYSAAAQTTRSFTVLAALPPSFTVTPSAGVNGSISPATAQSVVQNTTAVFTVTPASGYVASVGGTCGGNLAGNTYTTNLITADCTVIASFTQAPVALQVSKAGTGQGTVSSSPAGISCGADCSEILPVGTVVTLTATPAGGSSFAGWSGAICTGGNSTATCSFTLNAATTVTATFNIVAGANTALHDLNDDGKSDIIWRNDSTGANWYWAMNGTTIAAQGPITTLPIDWQIQSTAVDFDGDGKSDILLRNMTTGQPWIWFMNGNSIIGGGALPTLSDLNWTIAGTGDLNGDGKGDVIWRNTSTGANWWWALNGTSIIAQGAITTLPPEWQIQSTLGDFNGDGKTDILWRNMTTGQPWIWFMNGNTITTSGPLPTLSDLAWTIAGTGDLNGDGKHDVVWRNTTTGANWYWALNGTTITAQGAITTLPVEWSFQSISGDFNGDGKADILLRNLTTGQPWIWFMNGNTITGGGALPTLSDLNWQIRIRK